MWALSHEPCDRTLQRKGLVPTPAIPGAATPVAAITPRTPMIAIIPVIPVVPMIPMAPIATVVAVAMAPAKTAKFEDFCDPHIVSSLFHLFLGLEPTPRVERHLIWGTAPLSVRRPISASWPPNPSKIVIY